MIDLSELEGKSFSCVEGCAMCCLCQPELTEDELKVFETDEYLRAGLTREHVAGRRTSKPTAIKLQGKWGACYYLKNRRCTINEIKPRFCRQFPIHIHVLRRIQLNVNLACRGVTFDNENELKAHGKAIVQGIPKELLDEVLAKTKKVAHEFDHRCHDAGVHQSVERISSISSELLPIISKEDGIGKLLAFADEEPVIGDSPNEEVVARIKDMLPPENLNQMAKDSNHDLFELEELARLPVYVDEELMWNLFQSKDGMVNCMVLEEDGVLELRKSLDINEIDLLPRDEATLEVFAEYAKTLIGRDQFEGYVAHVCDMHDYRHDLMTVYFGVLGTQLLDLWWRTSLLGKIYQREEIDRWLALEGIRAFDMDCLDAPTIGTFV